MHKPFSILLGLPFCANETQVLIDYAKLFFFAIANILKSVDILFRFIKKIN